MNLKRFLSLILVFAMVMSLGISVSASTELEITYLNADNSAIHIEFSNGVKVSNLSSYLTLESEGEVISYTVTETIAGTVGGAEYANNASAADNAAVYDYGTTYTIVPTGGIKFNIPYVISVSAGLTSEDAALTLENNIKKIIKVREIFTEDFSKTYDGAAYLNNGGSFSITNQEIVLTSPSNGWMTLSLYPLVKSTNLMGNSQTLTMSQYLSNYKYGNGAESNVTISAKVKTGAAASGEFSLVTSWQTGTPNLWDNAYCPQLSSVRINNTNNTATITNRYGKTNEETIPAQGVHSKEEVSYTKTFADNSNNISASGYTEVKISEFSGKVKAYVDNKNILNLKNSTGEANGIFALRSANVAYYVDDVCVTKMEEVEVAPLEYMGIETSLNGIVAEFSGKLNTNVLRNAITFTEDGETLSTFNLTDISEPGKYKYLIAPVGGLTLGAEYTLTINAGIESIDGLTTPLASAVNESFTITLPEITLDYFDADASAINLELSKKVNLAQLNNSIILKREGITLEYDLYDASVTPTGISGASQTVTYQIVPKEGMKLDVTYSLEIKKGILSLDGESAVMNDIVKNFKVEKLMFEGFDYETTEEFRSVWLSANNKDEMENGVLKYTISSNDQNYILVHPYGNNIMMGDSEFTGQYFSRTYMQTQKNYTVQADIKIGDATKTYSASLLALHKGVPESASGEYNSFNYRIRFGVAYDTIKYNSGIQAKIRTWYTPYKADGGFDDAEFNAASDDEKSEYMQNNKITKDGWVASDTPGLNTTEYKTLRLSVRDGYFKGYLGYLNTASYLNEQLRTATGGAGFVFPSGQNGQIYYIDNMYITRMVEVLPVTSNIKSGTTEVETKPELVIKTGKTLDKTTVGTTTVKVKTDDGYINATDYTATCSDGTNISITFKNNLNSKTMYYVVLDGIKLQGDENATVFETISFKTKSPDYEIDSFKVTNSDGGEGFAPGEVTVSAKVKNNYLDTPQSFVMSLCVYNENNQLIAVKAQKYTIAKGEEAQNTLTVNIGDGSYKAKCFVWSDFTLMTESLEEKIIE